MLSPLGKISAIASLASLAVAQSSNGNASVAPWPTSVVDFGNGVHSKLLPSYSCLSTVIQLTRRSDPAVPGAIPANLYEPLQHRLAYAGSTGMTVSWSTYKQLQKPTVFYTTDPRNFEKSTSSNESTTYETSRTYNNHVTLTGLKPATKYWYQGKSYSASILWRDER